MVIRYFIWIILSFFSLSHLTYAQENTFVGTEVCASCHQNEFKAWKQSDHEKSMKHANKESVLGDFIDAKLTSSSEINKFFMKGKEYWVNIKGLNGEFNDYQIKYTFGYYPLQQYMVEFSDGRMQLIPFAWDSRNKKEGGQRWFNLYPMFKESTEEFFWTNAGQNWNYMCADCHSTNLQKNFDVEKKVYNTTYSEINVGCEACHGAGSKHVSWTEKQSSKDTTKGFDRNLKRSVSQWVMREGSSTLFPESITQTQQTVVCAQCHSRRVQISDTTDVKDNQFGERYILNMINGEQYHADGQIYDEVFVYGSFLQSKMSRNGVVCTNCHEPHTNKLIMPIENVCLQCHLPNKYNNKSHHNHETKSEGAQCVSCHMPETTYMEVDSRRDHGWHVPNPKLAKQLNTPDTCLSCHDDQNSTWSSSYFKKWYPNPSKNLADIFAPIFKAVDDGDYRQAANLFYIAENEEFAPIIQASAIDRMSPFPNEAIGAISKGIQDTNEFVRLSSARAAENISEDKRWELLLPLLTDDVLAVRNQATYSLISLWPKLSIQQRNIFKPAIEEYIETQEFNNDRGFSHNNKGTIYLNMGNIDLAVKSFQASIAVEPKSAQAYLNLAELYRRTKQTKQDEAKVLVTLKEGIANIPKNGMLHYSLGLSYIRSGDTSRALTSIEKATLHDPANSKYQYAYGLSLETTDVTKAEIALNKAYTLSKSPKYLYALCEMKIRHKSPSSSACINQLSNVAPANITRSLRLRLNSNN